MPLFKWFSNNSITLFKVLKNYSCQYKKYILLFSLIGICVQAKSDWTDIDNYQGKIGKLPIHLSLKWGKRYNDMIVIHGVYYYDKYRTPIIIRGSYQDKKIYLCEFKNLEYYEKQWQIEDFTQCVFTLEKHVIDNINYQEILTGEWQNKDSRYPVKLTRHNVQNGDIEIPYWGDTQHHMFVGVYETGGEETEINKIKVISKKVAKWLKSLTHNFIPVILVLKSALFMIKLQRLTKIQ